MKNKFLCFLIALVFSFGCITAQDMKYTRKVIETLSGPDFHGRGYVNKGCAIAADYISGQFETLKLNKFDSTFRQHFSFPVNTFPGKVSLSVDKKKLIPGKDFIVDPGMSAMKGSFSIVSYLGTTTVDSAAILNADFTGKIIATDNKRLVRFLAKNPVNAVALIFLEEKKLTWSVAKEIKKFPTISVLKSSFPEGAKSISLEVENVFIEKYDADNIIGYLKGTQIPDSFLVFSAHYDHLGQMGNSTYFPGANDNAAGIAMLLNLCKYYIENPPKYSIAFIAFAGEEAGLVGSKYYTENPVFPLHKIKFLINLDLVGTGDEGLMVVNGSIHKKEFGTLTRISETYEYLPQVKKRGKAANSDHYYFSEKGVPAIFLYTLGGISAYHDIDDKAETLPLTKFENLFKLINAFVKEF